MRRPRLLAPGRGVDRLERARRGGERLHAGLDRQIGGVGQTELLRARMDVHQGLLRLGDVDQAVAAARCLAEPGADEQQQVGVAHALAERRRHRDADVAGVVGVAVVEVVLAAERDADRQIEALGERLDVGAGLSAPAAAAQHHERPSGPREQPAQARHVGRRRVRLGGMIARRVGAVRGLGQHVLGQRDHHRPRPARDRGMERPADRFRDARRIVDLVHPFGERAEHRAVVDLLKRLAPAHPARHLADEQDHRGRILARDVHAVRAVGRARAAGDHGDAGPAGELAVSLRHHGGTTLLAADHVADLAVVERIEEPEIAFAGDAERQVDAVDLELVDQDLAAGSEVRGSGHVLSIGSGPESSPGSC